MLDSIFTNTSSSIEISSILLCTAVSIVLGVIIAYTHKKTSKEILSVFFAMTIGLATGMGHIFFASLITVIVSLVIFIFSKIKLFDVDSNTKILKILVPENLDYTDMFDEIFNKYVKEYKLQLVKTMNMGSLFELHYVITLKSNINEKKFIDELRVRNGNLKIMLSHELDGSEM